MISVLKRFFSLLLVLSSFFVLVYFRNIPMSKLWDGYTVFYAEKTITEDTVLSLLKKSGCKGIVTLSNQKNNFRFASMSPVRSLENEDSFFDRMKLFFFDEHNEYQIYYIPNGQEQKLSEAVQMVSELGSCGVDLTMSFPFVIPAICVLFFLFLMIRASQKLVFVFLSLYPLLMVFMIPDSLTGASVSLCLYGLYLLQRLWKRNKAFISSSHIAYVAISMITPIFICLAMSPKNALLYIDVLVGIFAMAKLCSFMSAKRHGFVPIMPAAFAPSMTQDAADYLFICSGSILLQLVFALFPQQQLNFSKSVSGLVLPTPVVIKSSVSNISLGLLPNLNDYFEWAWKEKVFPYTSLYDKVPNIPSVNDKVVVPKFEQKDSNIVENDFIQYSYDEDFFQSVLDEIDKIPYPALEQMLKKQGRQYSYAYSSRGNAESLGLVNMFILLLTVCIPLGMALHYMIGRRKQYAHSI